MHLSVIIPTFNGEDVVAEQLDALAQQASPGPFEVIIADNGSTDKTLEVVARYVGKVPGLRVIDASARPGRCYARNAGAEAAKAEALAFTDQDDVVGDAWARAMATALEEHDFVTGPTESKSLNEPWRIENSVYPEHEPYVHKHPPFFPHAPANNLGIKRVLHQKIGGFDESLMSAWEDADYSFRLYLQGTKLYFHPEAILHYRLRHDFGGIYRQAIAYGRGNVSFYKKYEAIAPVEESWRARIGAWTSLLRPRTILGLRKKATRAVWLSRLGWRIGHLQGCVEHRVLAPSFWT
jgi:glycosyltransferase involved in cell wall biosynthesis